MNALARTQDIVVACVGIGLALVVLFIWIPSDISTGIIDVWRRNVRIGDAMLPTFAAIGILLASGAIGLRAVLRLGQSSFRKIELRFLCWCVAILTVAMALMMWTGPLLASIWSDESAGYRVLRAQSPWKYAGFIVGGFVLVYAFISFANHRFSWRFGTIALIATVAIAAFYDLPFNNLILPPNGDF